MSNSPEIIVLGGGCFWCTEAVYVKVRGITDVESGYSNGTVQRPSYEQVCTGTTGHNEVVKLTYDPAQISLDQILQIFFVVHDPTTLNRQGEDVGTQYRSAIFHHSPEQEAAARLAIAELTKRGEFPAPIVTEVTPAEPFYTAEWYHDEYFLKNGNQPYCQFVVAPKVAKFRKLFSDSRKTVAPA